MGPLDVGDQEYKPKAENMFVCFPQLYSTGSRCPNSALGFNSSEEVINARSNGDYVTVPCSISA